MLRASMEWRRNFRVDDKCEAWARDLAEGHSWVTLLVERYKVHSVIGTDRWGLPVCLFRWSVFDIAGAEREMGPETCLLVLLYLNEQLVYCLGLSMLEHQTCLPGCLSIWDIGNYGGFGAPNWWSRMIALVRFLPKVAEVMEANYPEMIRRVMVIRCGPATRALYHLAAPILPPKTLGKCTLYGWHAREWLPSLREEVPDGNLPAFLEKEDAEALMMAEPRGGIYPEGARARAEAEEAERRAAERDRLAAEEEALAEAAKGLERQEEPEWNAI